MRTTIDIEDDVLAATKKLARLQNFSAGYIVSKLIREALAGHQQALSGGKAFNAGIAGCKCADCFAG